MKKRIIKGCAWALALVTAVSLLAVRQDAAYGAGAVDPEATPRGLKFDLADNGGDEYEELLTTPIPIHYYKIADMNIPTGTYKDSLEGKWEALENVEYKVVENGQEEGYEIILKGQEGYEDASAETKTANLENVTVDTSEQGRKDSTYAWEALARKAKDILGEEEGRTATLENGTATIDLSGDDLGMYLIFVKDEDVKTDYFAYTFTPFLISVPTSGYADGVSGDSDQWIYEVNVGLKPEQKERYASLRITKTLDDYNATLGGALFVFDVTAEKDGKIVYSDVVQLDFDGPGNKSVLIGPEEKEGVDVVGKIPAGSTVTVTESYSGSAYEAVGAVVWSVEDIRADQAETAQPDETASFTNAYNGGLNGGAGVVNHFEYSESDEDWMDPVRRFVPAQTEGGNPQ